MGSKAFKELSNDQIEDYAQKLNLSVSEIRHIADYYKYTYKLTGETTKEEFQKKFKQFFEKKGNWKDEDNIYISQIFDLFDVDGNGILSFEEFLVGNVILSCRDPKESLPAFFKILDTDKDGYISKKEVLHVFKASRSILAESVKYVLTPEEYTENLMIKLDAKTEGKVSKEAFLNALSNDPEFSKYFMQLCGWFSKTAIAI